MTYRALRIRLFFVSIVLMVIISLSLAEYLPRFWPNLNLLYLVFSNAVVANPSGSSIPSNGTFVSQNATLIALIAGAYSAYCLQQRGKFIDELRAWWNDMVMAKSEFLMFCDRTTPSEEDFLKAFYKLSTAMDTLRLIYCNVNRTKNEPRGFYPFEQVRDIIDLALSLRPRWPAGLDQAASTLPTHEARMQIKRAIDVIFQSLRHAIQAEAKASPPDEPTRYDSPNRQSYLKVLLDRGMDVLAIREQNKRGN
jgi:hypothetical protein